MDRNAPDYGGKTTQLPVLKVDLTYNDFNTNYFTTAANASGGSSGSPVINIDGAVVALQAGGATLGATDFFFPLDRVKRALTCLQNNMPVTRGTIQTSWSLRPFDDCKRLGLTAGHESRMRALFPDAIGLLVADTILPGGSRSRNVTHRLGPADEIIEEGDMLLKINGEYINRFIRLEGILDDNVGGTIKLLLQRGSIEFEYNIPVQDKHSITPDRYVQVCGARFNTLSYQLARAYNVPVRGVYVCEQSGNQLNIVTNIRIIPSRR
jgi:pro-apoptotic serine protease NMA111